MDGEQADVVFVGDGFYPVIREAIRVEQSRRGIDDRVEHRLRVGRGARDDAKNLRHRRLLIQRLRQLAL